MRYSAPLRVGFLAMVWPLIMTSPAGAGLPLCEMVWPEGGFHCAGGEILDDGTSEASEGYPAVTSVTSSTKVQKFTPPAYPSVYHEVCVAWTAGEGDTTLSYEVVFYDDDGPGGEPGTLLAAVPTSASSVPYSGVSFYSTSVASPPVTDGSIYIGVRYDPSIDNFYLRVDRSVSTQQQVMRWSTNDGLTWYPPSSPDTRAFFIRARSSADYVVVPTAQESSDGNITDEGIPFGTALTRFQQVYLGSEVGPRWISEIRFRGARDFPGECGFPPFCPELFQDTTVKLSTTQRAVDDLTNFFSTNAGPDETVVFQGDLRIVSRGNGGATDVEPFDIVIPLETPFYFGGTGNLLLDMNLPDANAGTDFACLDAHAATDSVSRAFCSDFPWCNSDDQISQWDSLGLVTMFMFVDPTVFSDGFESGDTTEWSATVP